MGRVMNAARPHEVMTNLYRTTDAMTKDQGIANAGDKGTQASAAYTPGAHTHRPSSSSGARDRRPCFTGRGPNARTRRGYGTPIIAGREMSTECKRGARAGAAGPGLDREFRGGRGGSRALSTSDISLAIRADVQVAMMETNTSLETRRRIAAICRRVMPFPVEVVDLEEAPRLDWNLSDGIDEQSDNPNDQEVNHGK